MVEEQAGVEVVAEVDLEVDARALRLVQQVVLRRVIAGAFAFVFGKDKTDAFIDARQVQAIQPLERADHEVRAVARHVEVGLDRGAPEDVGHVDVADVADVAGPVREAQPAATSRARADAATMHTGV